MRDDISISHENFIQGNIIPCLLTLLFVVIGFALPLLTHAAVSSAQSCPQFTLTLSRGMTDQRSQGSVTLLQKFLKSQSASSSQLVTGYFGPVTQNNLAAFQALHHLPISSSTDPDTRAVIAAQCDTSATDPAVQAAFNTERFTSLTASPLIKGTAPANTALLLQVIPTKQHNPVFEKKFSSDASGNWSQVISPPIANGTYQLSLFTGSILSASSTLTVGLKSIPTVQLELLPPYDAADGKLLRFAVHADSSGSVALNQFTFQFSTMSADISQLVLTVYSDPAYTTLAATSTFPDGITNSVPVDPTESLAAIIPDHSIEIPAGETYYFELDGNISPEDGVYTTLTILTGDAVASTIGTVDELSPVSNFLWSPNTYGETSTFDADWLNSGLIPGLAQTNIKQVRYNTPGAPTCELSSDVDTSPQGQQVTLTWSSTDSTYAVWDGGVKAEPKGSKVVIMGPYTSTYSLYFFGPEGTTACNTVVYIPSQANQSTSNNSGGSGTATPTGTSTSTPLGSFTVVPSITKASSAVTVSGVVNNTKSCNAQTYTLGYGDHSTSTINVAAKSCKVQSFSYRHSYSKVGAYTIGLYQGTGTSSLQRIQTQTVTVTPKTALENTNVFNVAGVFYFISSGILNIQTLLNFLHSTF